MEYEELDLSQKKNKKMLNRLGKQLLIRALDNFYAFKSDEVEDALDKALLKFQGRIDWRKSIRIYLWSFPKLRNQICKEGFNVLGN